MNLYYTSSRRNYAPVKLEDFNNISHTFNKLAKKSHSMVPFLADFYEQGFKKGLFIFLIVTIPLLTAVVSIQEYIVAKTFHQVQEKNRQAQAFSAANANKKPLSTPLLGK